MPLNGSHLVLTNGAAMGDSEPRDMTTLPTLAYVATDQRKAEGLSPQPFLGWIRLLGLTACAATLALVPQFVSVAEGGASYDISFNVITGPITWSLGGSPGIENTHLNPNHSTSVDPPGTPGAAAFASLSSNGGHADNGPLGYNSHVSGNSVLVPGVKVTAQSIAFDPQSDGTVILQTGSLGVFPASQVTIPLSWTWSIHLTADNHDKDLAFADIGFDIVAFSSFGEPPLTINGSAPSFHELVTTRSTFNDSGSATDLLDLTVPSFEGRSFLVILRLTEHAQGIAATQIPEAPTWLLIVAGLSLVIGLRRPRAASVRGTPTSFLDRS